VTNATGTRTVYNIEGGPTAQIATTCDPLTTCDNPGEGMEWDWAHAWWDYKTDSGTKPSLADTIDILAEAWSVFDPWDRDNTHYFNVASGVYSALGSTQLARFEAKMEYNGAAMGDIIYP
jgi:hypothetical protein